MEVEVRDILTTAARRPHIGMALLGAAQDVGGDDELPISTRDDVARDQRSRSTVLSKPVGTRVA